MSVARGGVRSLAVYGLRRPERRQVETRLSPVEQGGDDLADDRPQEKPPPLKPAATVSPGSEG